MHPIFRPAHLSLSVCTCAALLGACGGSPARQSTGGAGGSTSAGSSTTGGASSTGDDLGAW